MDKIPAAVDIIVMHLVQIPLTMDYGISTKYPFWRRL